MRKQFGVPEGTKGAVVLSVSPGSPAATLGMKPGDVITKIGSRAISSSNEIVEVVSKMKSGESTSVAYSRFSDGATTKVEATVTF
jgi:serine protease Do